MERLSCRPLVHRRVNRRAASAVSRHGRRSRTAVAVAAYRVLPDALVVPVATLLPPLEIALGLLLLAGLATRLAAVVGTVLLLAFVAGLVQAWARGLAIDCGCFGGGGPVDPDDTGYGLALLRDLAFLAAIATLPPEIGLAFTPYPDVGALVRAAKAEGHEVLAGLPMQPKAWPRVSPGRNTLLVGAAPEENLRRLDWALARVGGATGVTGIMGSAFTESEAALGPVLDAVGVRGLAYLDARASARSVGVATAREAGVRAAANDRFLDESGSIASHLEALEAQAKREGAAIGYARPLPATIAALQAWTATLDGKGMRLVPPSSLAR